MVNIDCMIYFVLIIIGWFDC